MTHGACWGAPSLLDARRRWEPGVGTGAAAQAAAVVASTSYREEELGAATVEWGSEPAMERVVCVSLLHAA